MTRSAEGLGEFDIIRRYFAPLATDPAALSLLDDTAVLPVPEGQELIVTCDTVIEGVHFLKDDPAETIAHKALAVTLSDLAAKGARPSAYLLSLALKHPAADWLEAFASGLAALQGEAGICLVGGDTSYTPGPLSISITALGLVPQGDAILRRGALPGDSLVVSGTIGDAYFGLRLLQEPEPAGTWGLGTEEQEFLIDRYRRPQARTGLAACIRHCARASIDISDGLAGDAGKLCRASGVSATIEAQRVPLSSACAKILESAPSLLAEILSAGDDYEILAAMEESHTEHFAAEAEKHGIPVTVIGVLRAGEGEAAIIDAAGDPLVFRHLSYSHFAQDESSG